MEPQDIDLEQDLNSQDLSQDSDGAIEANQQLQDDWSSDKRSQENGMWYDPEKKAACPNRLYKSYREIEPKYTQYQQTLSKYGIKDHELLGSTLEEYKTLKDPNSEINLTYNAINALFNHEKYGPEVKGFFEQLAEKQELEKWGTKLPPEVKQRLDRIDELENKQKEAEHQQKTAEFEAQLESKVSEITKFCEGYGLGFDEKGFLEYCLDNKIGVDRMVAEFKSIHLDEVLSTVQNKSSQAVVKNLEKNSKSAVPSGNKQPAQSKTGPKTRQGLREAMEAVFKT